MFYDTHSLHGLNTHKQFGVGHDFIRNSTGWKWKVTSAFGLPGLPEVRQKTKLPIFPGFDINVDWNAQYELPELHGYVSSSVILCCYVLNGFDITLLMVWTNRVMSHFNPYSLLLKH